MSCNISILRSFYEENFCSAEKLAEKVIEYYYGKEPPNFPIDIFKILGEFGVFYEYRELDRLEGAYSPETDEYEAAILINIKRPFTRQRFTSAHELCHHIKDYKQGVLCPFNSKDPIEKFADRFAGELLMPKKYFREEAKKLVREDGYVHPDDAYSLCLLFGTSYEAVIWKLFYNRFLSFVPDKKFFRKAKPQKTLGKFSQKHLLEQIINSYTYFPQGQTSPLWHQFKNKLVFNDSRMEGINVIQEDAAKIITDLRLFGKESKYYKDIENQEVVEVIGHSNVYDFILNQSDIPDRYLLCELNAILFKLAPHGEQMGKFRKSDNAITGASIQTVHYRDIEAELFLTDKDIVDLISNLEQFTISEYLYQAAKIHHRLTQIHPFENGNGRVSRAILNWILYLKGLPPIFIPYEEKTIYVNALNSADNWDLEPLHEYCLKRLLYSFVSLNDELSLIFEYDYISD
ncbi:Fic family protein [Neobacillus mesonae]|uniref:Fic family protein n=1 Tax=Neobacillus mesonae TaxID=1193713 RepID=UPI00203C99E9|nr:Fic family protein [Neobacillus mesonae]MCM3567833.1 Fic family protein [Neobacillus mesonae]